MRVLIADDEPLALGRLARALAFIPEVDLVAAVRSGREAERLIGQLAPEVAILDIEMPDLDGLSVVERLQVRPHSPEVVFVTAYPEHALRAFGLAAADYVTKPFKFERLRSAVRRAKTRLNARTADERFNALQKKMDAWAEPGPDERFERDLWIRRPSGLVRLSLDDVDFIEAHGDYVEFHTAGGSHMNRGTISALAERLDPAKFARCHRSVIISLDRVRGLRRAGRGLTLTLTTGKELSVGPRYVERLSDAMKVRRWW